MKPEFGVVYSFTVNGEPVPKSTQKPPRHKAAYHIVQSDPKYKRLKETWAYQELVAESALAAGIPQFAKDDPIELALHIFKSGRKMGDTKNIIAAVEDGLQYGGFIPNDKQIVAYDDIDVSFGVGAENARVEVWLQLYPSIDMVWLRGYFGSKKKAQEYYGRMIEDFEDNEAFNDAWY